MIGTVIGTGVFLKSAVMAQEVGSPALVLAAWVAAGFLSLAGALSYAELGALLPHAGGEYVYLRQRLRGGAGIPLWLDAIQYCVNRQHRRSRSWLRYFLVRGLAADNRVARAQVHLCWARRSTGNSAPNRS